jgi:hypothetical protein
MWYLPDALQMIHPLVTQGTLQPDYADEIIATGPVLIKYLTVVLTAERHLVLP